MNTLLNVDALFRCAYAVKFRCCNDTFNETHEAASFAPQCYERLIVDVAKYQECVWCQVAAVCAGVVQRKGSPEPVDYMFCMRQFLSYCLSASLCMASPQYVQDCWLKEHQFKKTVIIHIIIIIIYGSFTTAMRRPAGSDALAVLRRFDTSLP